jgi:hypothetical protein
LHDLPVVDIVLARKRQEPFGGNDSFCDLPLFLLPLGKVGLRVVILGCFRLTQKFLGNRFDLACVEIEEGRLLVELHFQLVDDVRKQNGGGHVYFNVRAFRALGFGRVRMER